MNKEHSVAVCMSLILQTGKLHGNQFRKIRKFDPIQQSLLEITEVITVLIFNGAKNNKFNKLIKYLYCSFLVFLIFLAYRLPRFQPMQSSLNLEVRSIYRLSQLGLTSSITYTCVYRLTRH